MLWILLTMRCATTFASALLSPLSPLLAVEWRCQRLPTPKHHATMDAHQHTYTHTNTYIDVVRCVNAPARILRTPSRRHHHYHHLLAIRNACLWSPLDVYYLRFILLLSAFLYCEVRPFLCIRWQLQWNWLFLTKVSFFFFILLPTRVRSIWLGFLLHCVKFALISFVLYLLFFFLWFYAICYCLRWILWSIKYPNFRLIKYQ